MKKRGTLPLLILSFEVLVKPSYKNKQRTPTPNMKCHQTEQSTYGRSVAGYTYPKGRLLPSCFGWNEILQDFKLPKQALINAFYLCLQTFLGFATAKLLYFFELSKSSANKNAIYAKIA